MNERSQRSEVRGQRRRCSALTLSRSHVLTGRWLSALAVAGMLAGCDTKTANKEAEAKVQALTQQLEVERVKVKQAQQEHAELQKKLEAAEKRSAALQTEMEAEARKQKAAEDRPKEPEPKIGVQKRPPSPEPSKAAKPAATAEGDLKKILAIANACYDREDSMAAKPLFELAVEKGCTDGMAHFRLAKCLADEGQNEPAVERYKKAIELLRAADPKSRDAAKALNNLGLLHRKMGKVEDAHQALGAAVEIDPNYATAFFNLGTLYAENLED
ncbi:MAG: tetratricopeptide repeat protein, partial [Planctomycetes bacterium]|nr:tetratricopeptide repeat protein [Planctomycetota bacterium]